MMRRYGKPLRAYYCRFCGGYHLTSKVTKSEAEQLASAVLRQGEREARGVRGRT